MGCCSQSQNKSLKTHPIINREQSEVEELAQMPLRAKQEDTDLVSQVEISVRCYELHHPGRGLVNVYLVMSSEDQPSTQWEKCGRTEVVQDQNPIFIKTFTVHYYFEKQQRFKFTVMNAEGDTDAQHRELGTIDFSIHELVCSPSSSITKAIKNSMKFSNGFLTVTSNDIPSQHRLLTMQWCLEDCSHKGQLYIRLCRFEGEEYLPVYKSEVARAKNKTVNFDEIQMTTHALSRDEPRRAVKIELYEASGSLVGSIQTSLEELQLQKHAWKATLSYGLKRTLTLKLVQWDCTNKKTFLDFVQGGCEISLVIGIDFTKSNGLPSEPDSLHFISNEEPNEYIKAVTAVGDILQYYDSDKRIPVYGFGAKLPPKYEVVSHCFALNDNIFDPEVQGIESVLQLYRSALTKVVLHGPTVFSQIIKTVSLYAEAKEVSQENQHYCILLILTDGIINDMELTKDEIVCASQLPISIIVVGVGKEDFSLMEKLDSDETLLESSKLNKTAARDIVQFVPFSKYKDRMHDLAREVLFEVPKQLITFFESKGIQPNPAKCTTDGLASFRAANPQTPQYSVRRHTIPSFTRPHSIPLLLHETKQNFINELVAIGFEAEAVEEVIENGLPAMDIQLCLEYLEKRKAKQGRVLKSALKKSPGGTMNRNVSIKEAVRCMTCDDREVDTVLMECGHSILCSRCVTKVDRVCPRCRQTIVKWILIHN